MKISKFFISALAACTFMACSNEPSETVPVEKGTATVSVVVKGGAETRADGTPIPGVGNENTMSQVEFFVFESNGNPDATYPYFAATSVTEGEPTSFLVTEANGKKFLVAVNQNIGQQAGNYDAVKAIITNRKLWDGSNNLSQTAPTLYEMAGEATANVIAGETNTISMIVYRLLSKVRAPKVNNVDNTLTGSNIDAINNNQDFLKELFDAEAAGSITVSNLKWEFNGYALINGINVSYAFDNGWTSWNPAGKNFFKTTYTNSDKEQLATVYAGSAINADLFFDYDETSEIFVYENSPEKATEGGNGQATTFVKDQVYGFLLKGTFSCDEYSDAVRYWRVNLIKDDVWKVFRNCVYEVTINNILTPGYGTPGEAEEGEGPIIDPNETSVSIDLNVAPWGFKTQGVDL